MGVVLTTAPAAPEKNAPALSRPLHLLFGLYLLASLAHFIHNAEYLPYYPNMPAWITRETVYLVWLGQAAVGAVGLVLAAWRWRIAALLAVAVFGAFGLDGLAHYTLALCSEHTLATNITIWAEAVLGLLLMLAAATRIASIGSARASAR